MTERIIVCCGASGWTRTIGWFQTIMNFLSATFWFVCLTGLSLNTPKAYTGTSGEQQSSDAYLNTEMRQDTNKTIDQIRIHQLATTVFFVYLVVALVGIVMGIFLLKGSYGKKPEYLKAWIFFAVMHLVTSFMVALAECFAGTYKDAIKNIYIFMVHLLIQGFCIGVVGIHMREIEMEKEDMNPPPYFKTYAI